MLVRTVALVEVPRCIEVENRIKFIPTSTLRAIGK